MLISACKTYTSPRRCAHAEIPERGCQMASAWLDSGKLMKSVMGYQRAELDICGGGTPPVYGETHLVHAHIHPHCSLPDQKNCRWGSNGPPVREQQVDRHFFMTSALSLCAFHGGQHEMTEFPAR